ncbi:Uncharacterized protein FWK35_00008785 [Aphis craccivora]|uniref:CUB domain-containing protein n=1 Tax=Aphis craccivora TaxID=307492 RepID=A0A6G0ZFE0_APHCR|nr:Uncharacterized protein FWK35_00008785 [Aphis craccivora]
MCFIAFIADHSDLLCNVTIKADMLLARSNSTFGQIKSPAMSGPNYCWYTLDPGYDRRVELQIYRLINVGHFNGSRVVLVICDDSPHLARSMRSVRRSDNSVPTT